MKQSQGKSIWKWSGSLPSVLILGLGLAVMVALAMTKPRPQITPPEERSEVVEIMVAESGPQPVKLEAMGTVSPSRELMVLPQVSGRVVAVSPNLVPGGRLREGEVLVRIDDRDYVAARRQAWAQVEEARAALDLEQGRQAVAQKEWELMGREGEESSLALRKPQLASARARRNAALAAYEQAKLNLERCVIKAPFDALVRSRSVEVGQLAGPSSRIAVLAGTHTYWLTASVPVSNLSWISLPDAKGAGGAPAVVTQEMGEGHSGEWRGRVIRLLGDLEPAGRMARLLIEVDDPLGMERGDGEALPLLIDAYARVVIDGRTIERAVAIPREAVREGDQVWVMNDEDRLEIRKPEITWRRAADVLVTSGIADGERVVVSDLTTPLAGLPLRVVPASAGTE